MSSRLSRLGRAFPILLACGCGFAGTETGNPDLQLRMQLAAYTSDPDAVALPTPQALSTGVLVSRAIIGVEEIELVRPRPDGSCDPYAEGKDIDTFFTADLVRGRPLPEVTLASGESFCAVYLELDDAEELPTGTEHRELLGDARLHVEGSRADGTPFVLRSEAVRELAFVHPSPRTFRGDELFLVAFDVARWFAEIDLDALVPEDDGTIRIDERRNTAALRQFEAALAASLGACVDPDDDGRIERCEWDDDDDWDD